MRSFSLYPGRAVQYTRPPFTFTARIVNVTPRGNVRLRLVMRDGKPITPLIVCVKPSRVEAVVAQCGELAFAS